MPLGVANFKIISQLLDRVLQVEENEVIEALYLLMERLKITIEPACATTLAAIMRNKSLFYGKNVVVVLTGGNIDL